MSYFDGFRAIVSEHLRSFFSDEVVDDSDKSVSDALIGIIKIAQLLMSKF